MLETGLDAESFDAFLDTLRRFVRERLVPAEARAFEEGFVPADILAEMQDLGLFGLNVPEAYGGSGLSIEQYIEVILELSWAAPAFRSAMAVTTGIVTSALCNDATEEQRQHYLPKLLEGTIAGFCLTEPDSGTDSAALKARAIRDGDCYVINGTKRFITNGSLAGFFIVMARTTAEKLPGNAHVSAFLIPADTPGLTRGKADKKMGQMGAITADVVLEDVRIPTSSLLGGEEGKGFKTAMKALDGGRLSVAAASIGYSRRILATALKYASEREAFGEPIGNFQLVQAMLADSKMELYAAECMLRDAVRSAAKGKRVSTEAACVKVFASEMATRIADRCVQIHGGAGYMAEYEAERFYRDVRVYRIYEGTTQILQTVIAKAMLKELAEAL